MLKKVKNLCKAQRKSMVYDGQPVEVIKKLTIQSMLT
ncbi:putative manganese-dependent inorganic pyrophosphatase [Bacillus sp. B14905]|nr:putative manganese-dependent inorganic pyrophosphatase [Bacillus sp. B14905]